MSVYELNYITCFKVNFSTVCYEQSRKLHTHTHAHPLYSKRSKEFEPFV